MTPAAAQTREAVAHLPITQIGVYNRRPIAGTNVWSQHSWANALDLHVDSLEDGDTVHAYLSEHKTALGIRVLLWRVTAHFDHVHADFWPKGINTPPFTQRGKGWFRYSDGRETKAPIPEIPAEGEGVDDMSVLKHGDSGHAVTYFQEALNVWGDPDVTPLTPDGAFGPATEAAVREYQRAAQLSVTGTIGGVEAHLIGRYHPAFVVGDHEAHSHPEYVRDVTVVR